MGGEPLGKPTSRRRRWTARSGARFTSATSTRARTARSNRRLAALLNPYYDMQRLGMFFTASPRHADVLLVTGPVTRPMEEPLRRTYEAMPEPRVVVAAGTDACSGSIWTGPEVLGGVDRVLPVDVYIPGDPPSPIALLHGLLLAAGRVRRHRRRARARWPRRRRSGVRHERARDPDDRRLRRPRAGLALEAGAPPRAWRLGVGVAARRLGWRWPSPGSLPCSPSSSSGSRSHWFGLGRGGVHVDQLAGLFLILTGLVSALLFLTAATARAPGGARAPPVARAVRGRRDRGRQRVRVPDRVRADGGGDLRARSACATRIRARRRAAALTLTLAKLGGGAVLAGLVLLGVEGGRFLVRAAGSQRPASLLGRSGRVLCASVRAASP